VATVHTFLRLLEEKNIEAWIELWADDADQYYPYGQRMFPPHLSGKDTIYQRWRTLPDAFESLSFPVRDTWVDGNTVVARFDGRCVTAAGREYTNTYVSVFTFDAAGKIREYSEYFDPILAGTHFGLLEVTYLEQPERDSELAGLVDTPLVRWSPRSGTLDIFDRDLATEMIRRLQVSVS
jgi:ketosteroid isomerase-like protein